MCYYILFFLMFIISTYAGNSLLSSFMSNCQLESCGDVVLNISVISEYVKFLVGHISVVTAIFHCLACHKNVEKGKWEEGKRCLDIVALLSRGWAWRCVEVGLIAYKFCWWVEGGKSVLLCNTEISGCQFFNHVCSVLEFWPSFSKTKKLLCRIDFWIYRIEVISEFKG